MTTETIDTAIPRAPKTTEDDPTPTTDDDEISSVPDSGEDMDLADWLTGRDVEGLVDFFVLHNGKRLKIAPITDREESAVRKQCMAVNPANPKGARRLNAVKWRNLIICTSLNKASGKREGDPGYVIPEHLAKRPTGEL